MFCISDLTPKSSSHNTPILSELHSLPIIPLLNGRIGTLTTSAPHSPLVYILSKEELALFGKYQEVTLHPTCASLIHEYIPLLAQSTNVRTFKPQDLPQFLPKILPENWFKKLEVDLDQSGGKEGEIGMKWIDQFWEYVHHHKLQVGTFVDWPLLPTTNNKLALVSSTVHRICCMVNLPVHACEFFKTLGVQELDATKFPSAMANSSDSLWSFVGRPQLTSLLDCAHSIFAFNLTDPQIEALFDRFTADQRRKLRQFVYTSPHHNKLSASQIEALRWFPIFEVFDSSDSNRFVNLRNHSEIHLPPSHIHPLLLNSKFLRVANADEEKFVKTLGVTQIQAGDFLINHVFPVISKIDEQVREDTMLFALQNMAKLQTQNNTFLEALQNLEFVPSNSSNKALKKPSHLYHPKLQAQLTDILHPEDFPIGHLATKDHLPYLEKLGLKTEMNREGFLICAQRVAEFATPALHPLGSPQYLEHAARAVARARALLAYLDGHFTRFAAEKSSKITREYFVSEIQSAKWVPVMVMPETEGGIPWARSYSHVQAPLDTR